MADMLKFRKGTYAQINAADKVAGTIYIAKDEKAMYVDVDASTRIRIGDFIRVDTVEGIKPPYSTSALYYVENDNALLKYVETEHEGVKTGTWKQVNGTDDLKASITSLQGNMSQAKSDISTLKTDTSTLKTDVSGLKDTVGSSTSGLVKDVANLKAAIGMGADGTPEGIGSTVATLVQDLDTLEGTVKTQGETISEHTSQISVLQTESAKHALKTDLDAYAKTVDVYKKTETYTKTEVDSAINADVLVEKNRAVAEEERLAGLISTAQGKANEAYALASEKATLEDVAAVGYALATDVESDIATAKQEAIDDAASKYATIKTVNTLDGKVSKNTGDITKINTALESVVTKTELEGKNYATTTQVDTAKSEAITAAANDAATKYATIAALNTTNQNVSAAQGRADDAYELAEGKTTAAEVKTQIEAYGYATTTQVATAKQQAIKAAKDAGDKAYAPIALVQTVDSINGTIGNAEGGLIKDIADAKKAAKDANDNANTRVLISEFNAFETNNTAAIADAKQAGTEAAAQAETNRQNIASLTATVNKLDGDVKTDGSVKKQIKDATDALKTVLSAEIDADIRAANAMEYVGTIESASGIPTTGVKNGATYVIGTSFGSYAAGDMLIAQGDENPDTGLIANPRWAHVKSGYDASLDQQLTGANNKIMLSNGVRNDEDAAGAITFAATGSASVAVADNTVTIGMVWEDFN